MDGWMDNWDTLFAAQRQVTRMGCTTGALTTVTRSQPFNLHAVSSVFVHAVVAMARDIVEYLLRYCRSGSNGMLPSERGRVPDPT